MLYRFQSLALLALTTFAMLPLAACTSDDDDGDDELGDATDGDTTDGDTTDGDTTDDFSGEETSVEEENTTDGDTTDGDTTGGDTTGDTTGELDEELCAQLCVLYGECTTDVPGCLEACLEEHAEFEGACLGAEQALTACVGGLTCDELFAYFDAAEPFPCQAEQAEVQACLNQGEGCEWSGGSRGAEDCSFEYICPDAPVHAVECSAEGCTCLEDGVEVGGCSEAVEFCAIGDEVAANACCDWQL